LEATESSEVMKLLPTLHHPARYPVPDYPPTPAYLLSPITQHLLATKHLPTDVEKVVGATAEGGR